MGPYVLLEMYYLFYTLNRPLSDPSAALKDFEFGLKGDKKASSAVLYILGGLKLHRF